MGKTALSGKRGTLFYVAPESLVTVVDPSHYLYDERAKLPVAQELIDNICEEGVKVPLFVVKEGADTLIVAGRQRKHAACLANLRRKENGKPPILVPAICLRGAKESVLKVAILENEARQEDTPIGKAKKVRRYIDLRYSADPLLPESELKREAAVLFAVTTKTIEARLKLLDLAPVIQAAVESSKIGLWAATELASLPAPEQESKLAELEKKTEESGKRPSVEDAKRSAGKGDSKKREAVHALRTALLDAAERYGAARMDEEGIAEAKDQLLAAALDYYKVASAPRKTK